MRQSTLRDVIEERVEKHGDDGCWVWLPPCDKAGYGRIQFGGRVMKAHRASYEVFVGPIPEGLTIDHLCRNTSCVNPAHLEPCTGAENTRRARLHRTRCKRGHEFTAENTRIRESDGQRVCRACQRLAQEKYQRRLGRKDRDVYCRNGHLRTPENTRTTKAGGRDCKDCAREKYLKPGGYFDPKRPRKTHCKNGHAYTPENTYEFERGGRTYRYCRECNRAAARRKKAA